MKFLITGLGNPGSKYESTRHNVGFKVLDALANASNTKFSVDRHGEVTEIKHKGRTLLLLKPTTFMNLSGKAVNYWLQKEKIGVENSLVITDDISLPLGQLRMKGKGSDGGHNGLKSIQESLGTNKYPRLRFGIGNDFHQGQQVNYVLGNWELSEIQTIESKIKIANDIICSFCTIGIDRTMNFYNNK